MIVTTTDQLNLMVRMLQKHSSTGGIVAFDTETTSLDPIEADLVGMSFAMERESGFYIPVGHTEGKQLDLEQALLTVKPLLEAGTISAHNGRYDWQVMKRHGIDVWLQYDSLSIWRLLGIVEHGLGLKDLVELVYGEKPTEFGDISDGKFNEVAVDVAAEYAIADATNCYRLTVDGLDRLSEPVKRKLLDAEVGAMRIAAEMEYHGVPVDLDFVLKQIERGTEVAELVKQDAIEELRRVVESKGEEFPEDLNLRSTKQMTHVLYDLAGYPIIKRTPKGNPSTDQTTIERLAKEHGGAIGLIADYRSAMTFTGRFEELVEHGRAERDWWFVHASLNPAGTSTGRWSGQTPNVQNHPKGVNRYEGGGEVWEVSIRDAIAAPPGFYIVSSDYSQVELRVAAGESREPAWLNAFRDGVDVHRATAAAIYGIRPDEVTDEQRHVGKTLNFSMLFGAQEKKVAEQLGIELDEAHETIQRFWKGLPEVARWASGIRKFAVEHGFVETAYGRRRHLHGINSGNKWEHLRALRESVNTVVQGTAADILKIGLSRQQPMAKQFGAEVFLTVHDQFVWLVPVEVNPREFCLAMEELICFPVYGYPELVADYGIGYRFGSLTTYDTASEVPSEIPHTQTMEVATT